MWRAASPAESNHSPTDFMAKLQDVYLNMASILATSSGVTLKRYGWSRFGVGVSHRTSQVARSKCVYIVCKPKFAVAMSGNL
ncbi:uncharacterized protein Dere_GG27220 [Drosophila erecta]|uniref:Uncharacterized protein n=1 Tax=Drosophila erecta TaxID=7220 RepID=A0A0Q5WLX8_DROER|nr:uncharacterized protein Dere_GG27220 [Drosophila erecta]